jgi:hypothetical protein
MTLTIEQIITLGGLAVGGVAWLIRMEARVNGHDRELRDVKDDVRYIRGRIDQFLERVVR